MTTPNAHHTLPPKSSLRDYLDANKGVGPGFHFLRHALSFVILAHHCRVAVRGLDDGGYEKGVALSSSAADSLTAGQMAVELLRPGLFSLVAMFFALSGFLVTGSALRNPKISTFFANRALRILPALSVEVTLSALLLGPLLTTYTLSTYFSDSAFWTYFQNIVGIAHFTLPGVFETNPWPDMVNANMWTLAPEFWCYFLTLIIMATGLILRPRPLMAAIAVGAIGVAIYLAMNPDISIRANTTHFTRWYIVLMFFFGMFYWLAAAKIPMNRWLFLACGLIYYVLTLFDTAGVLAGFVLTYCIVYAGFMSFRWFDRLLKDDLSYGMYLYGFPITQAVILIMLPALQGIGVMVQFLIIFPVVLALTLLFSYVSWKVIEKPALKLKKYTTAFIKAPASAVTVGEGEPVAVSDSVAETTARKPL